MVTPILQKGLRLFVEANELSGANGATVSSFTDLSGWNSHLTQSTSLPVIETGAINGKKAVVFDGTKNPLQNNESFTVNSGFLVINIDEFTNYNGILSSLSTYGILAGKNNQPYFFDFTDFLYYELRLNDRVYPRENAPAPIDSWGIVFFRTWLPTIYDGIQIGRDRLDNTRRADFKIALLALYNREWCESDIRLNTESIAHSYQIAINNVFPYQGSKSDAGEIGKPHISDGQLEPVIDEKSDRTYASYDLDFQNRRQSEYKIAKTFYFNYYPGNRFIYRHYNEIPPVDIIGRGTTNFQDRGNNGALKNYGFGFTESAELSAPQIPVAPAIPVEINDLPPTDTEPTITTTVLPDASIGTAYSQAISKTGGNTPFVWAVISGALPSGISLNSSTGVLSGTSTATGAHSFTIRVTDDDGDFDEQVFTLSVIDTQPVITTTSLPSAAVGIAYNQTINRTGGEAPFTWSIVGGSGNLPDGLSLNALTGALTGTPTESGDFNFTVRVTDNDSDTDDQIFSFTVNEAPEADAVLLLDGDSRIDQTYYDSSPAGTNLKDKVQALLPGVAAVHNIAVAGGALATGSGSLNLTASLETRLGSHFDGAETHKIIYILSLYNDFMASKTPAQYMADLQTYITTTRSLGATHVIVGSPANSDYLGQNSAIHLNNLVVIDLLRTEFLDATPFGHADNYYLNTTSDTVIGIEADTADPDLFYDSGSELDRRLHFGEGYNDVLALYISEMVKRIAGVVNIPSIPSGLKVSVISDTEIEITVDPATDSLPVTSRSYRVNGGSPVSMGTALTVTVPSLTAGTVYSIQARATNASGSSDWCPAQTATTYPDFTGWTPASLAGAIWLKTPYQDTVGGTPADTLDEVIGAVKDENGTNHFTEATNKPVFKPDGISALIDSWYMNGTASKLSHATAGGLMDDDFTWIIPMKAASRGGGYEFAQAIVSCGDALNRKERGIIAYPYGGELVFSGGFYDMGNGGANIQTGIVATDNTAKFVWVRKTGTLVEIGVNKEKIVSGRPPLLAFTSQIIALGANPAGTQFLQGHLGECILVSSSLSDLNLHYALNYMDSLVNNEPPPTPGLTNWSLTATATASNEYPAYPASETNDGHRVGYTANGFWLYFGGASQWVRHIFDAPHPVEEINVFSLRGTDTTTPPTLSETTTTGLTAFTIRLKISGVWTDIDSVSGNDKLWNQFLITPTVAEGIEILMTGRPDDYFRLMELEAKG